MSVVAMSVFSRQDFSPDDGPACFFDRLDAEILVSGFFLQRRCLVRLFGLPCPCGALSFGVQHGARSGGRFRFGSRSLGYIAAIGMVFLLRVGQRRGFVGQGYSRLLRRFFLRFFPDLPYECHHQYGCHQQELQNVFHKVGI